MLCLSTSRVPTVFLHGWSQEREGTYQAEGITRIRVLVLDRNLRTVSLCKIVHSNHQVLHFFSAAPQVDLARRERATHVLLCVALRGHISVLCVYPRFN